MTKDTVIKVVQDLPPEFNLDCLFEKLVFVEKIEEGLQALAEGKTITQEELKEEIKKW